VAKDGETTLEGLRQAVAAFVGAREWEPFHTPKNLAMSIAIEAAELMERFQWLTSEQSQVESARPAGRASVADELADVIIYCLSFSNALDLDITEAVLGKLEVNERRYPASEFRGRYRKPEREK
jgi:NTP pyrophosphatase (non-canonical NTP hydrolase)